MLLRTEIWPSLYQDSVILMRLASTIRSRPGIEEAAAFMGTPSNQAILQEVGLATDEGRKAGPNDIIITVKAETESDAAAAFEAARALLSARQTEDEDGEEARPRTLDSALRRLPNANLAAISIPGEYAGAEALRALHRNLNVFLFSDNVPVATEIELKREALKRNLLCMGPDCGTAYLNGKGLGFFNVVMRGRVGCVAASGTGLQAVASRLAALGEGISQGIGVGGRDLSADVGGMMTLASLEMLADDPSTEAIVLISKPPHPTVMEKLDRTLAGIGKPVVVCCLGAPTKVDGRILWVATLDDAAEAAAAFLQGRTWAPSAFTDVAAVRARFDEVRVSLNDAPRRIVGLYTGGTLAHEAHLLLHEMLGAVGFNGRPYAAKEPHQLIDLGDDAYTVGRPHPMIAPETRSEILSRAGESDVGILLLDLVLGKGSHDDPAGAVAEALAVAREKAAARGRKLLAIGSVVGTEQDPQGLDRQIATLAGAGVLVFPSNAQAARFAALAAQPNLADTLLGDSK
jgi:succinyl-CoA synthetase alpha subunit